MMSEETESAERTKIRKWKDIECAKFASKGFFPEAVTDLAVQKVVITRFLNFYLGGRRQKGITVEDVVFAVLSIMPVSPDDETIVWHSGLFRKDGKLFFLSSDEKKLSGVKENIVKTEESANIELSEEIEEPSLPSSSSHKEQNVKLNDNIDTIINGATSQSDKEVLKNLFASINNVDIIRGIEEQLQFYNIQNHEASSNDSNQDEDNNHDNEVEQNEEHSENLDALLYGLQSNQRPVPKENVMIVYGPAVNAAFNTFCNTVLDNWEREERGRIVLKCFFAAVALVLMRATAKSYKHLVSTFHGTKFLNFLIVQKIVPAFNNKLVYFPPHKRCFKGAFRTFCKKADNTPVMFAKIIILSESILAKTYLKTVLRLLLNYTADYGFNLVSLWQRISAQVKSKKDLQLIVELTTCEETKSSWAKLIRFFSKYKNPECEEKFYRWARVLDPRFFKELSCLENYKLAVILTVFAEKLTGNSSLWGSTWVQNEELENFKQLGVQRYEKYLLIRTCNKKRV